MWEQETGCGGKSTENTSYLHLYPPIYSNIGVSNKEVNKNHECKKGWRWLSD